VAVLGESGSLRVGEFVVAVGAPAALQVLERWVFSWRTTSASTVLVTVPRVSRSCEHFPVAVLGQSGSLRVGEFVVAVGAPAALQVQAYA